MMKLYLRGIRLVVPKKAYMLDLEVLKVQRLAATLPVPLVNQAKVGKEHLLELLCLAHGLMLVCLPLSEVFLCRRGIQVLLQLLIPLLNRWALQINLACHRRYEFLLLIVSSLHSLRFFKIHHTLFLSHWDHSRLYLDWLELINYRLQGVKTFIILDDRVLQLSYVYEFLHNVLHLLSSCTRMKSHIKLGRHRRVV